MKAPEQCAFCEGALETTPATKTIFNSVSGTGDADGNETSNSVPGWVYVWPCGTCGELNVAVQLSTDGKDVYPEVPLT